MRNRYKKLEVALGYRFRRKKYLETALTHRSYRFETDDSVEANPDAVPEVAPVWV